MLLGDNCLSTDDNASNLPHMENFLEIVVLDNPVSKVNGVQINFMGKHYCGSPSNQFLILLNHITL